MDEKYRSMKEKMSRGQLSSHPRWENLCNAKFTFGEVKRALKTFKNKKHKSHAGSSANPQTFIRCI